MKKRYVLGGIIFVCAMIGAFGNHQDTKQPSDEDHKAVTTTITNVSKANQPTKQPDQTNLVNQYKNLVQEKLKFVDDIVNGAIDSVDNTSRVVMFDKVSKIYDQLNDIQDNFLHDQYLPNGVTGDVKSNLQKADGEYAVGVQADITVMDALQKYLDDQKPSHIEDVKMNLAVAADQFDQGNQVVAKTK